MLIFCLKVFQTIYSPAPVNTQQRTPGKLKPTEIITARSHARKYRQCLAGMYIPLISRVRDPYGKLWTEFFPSFYGPSAKRAGNENKEGKNEDP